jgi:hypothetical protein
MTHQANPMHPYRPRLAGYPGNHVGRRYHPHWNYPRQVVTSAVNGAFEDKDPSQVMLALRLIGLEPTHGGTIRSLWDDEETEDQ